MQTPKNHKLFWQSSYDRGLDILLFIWSDIREIYPAAELTITYGFDLFDKVAANNPERQEWKKHVIQLMQQPGITHLGRIGQDKLRQIRKEHGILAYPTYFTEIYMTGAVEAQADGLVPVTMSLAALSETAKQGVLVDGNILEPEVLEKYKQELISLMGDSKRWKELSHKCQKWAIKQTWSKTANEWVKEFEKEPEQDTLVTIYTPSIRTGWWNIMGYNLSKQTYKNFEWLIVDDHKEDRSATAKKYAEKYGLNIRYLRGKERSVKRNYKLINANNTALKAAKGSLFVFLQDFVLIQPTAIEELVTVHKQHPNDLIAPVDVYYEPKIKPDTTNAEDWFNSETNVVGKFMRKNIRIQNMGFRMTTWPFDFEQNFGAIPTHILKQLNGWWEFQDDALGFDNTEIAYRAMKLDCKIWIDELNIAICLDHWGTVGANEGGINRNRNLNDPRFDYLVMQTEKGVLPLVRDEKLDDKTVLSYTIPESVKDDECGEWIKKQSKTIAEGWM